MMASNLMKSPLTAILFASLLYFSGAFAFFYSADYIAAYEEFTMPISGNLFLLAYTMLISLAAAVVFGASEKSGIGVFIPLLITTLGTAYITPMTEPLLFGPRSGMAGVADALSSAGVKSLCTIVIFILALLVYKTDYHSSEELKGVGKPDVEYKLKTLGFIVRLIVLSVVFCVLFYVSWYFLFWSNADVRAFYDGPVERLGFVPSIVNSLMTDSWMLLMALTKGFLYAVFALPLLFLLKGKRVILIVSTVMLYLAGPVWTLIPTPYIPDNVRIPMFVQNAALLLVFGIASGVLLHTSFKREEKPAATVATAQKPLTPQQQAIAAARAKAAQGSPTVKQAADVVSKTMSGQAK